MLLASDDANKEFTNPRNPDRALLARFYQRSVPHNFNIEKNKTLLAEQEKLPEFILEDWIHVSIPGRADMDLHEPARDDHKRRFPAEWDAYQNHVSEAEQVSGTKLSDWKDLSQLQVEALKASRFYTVEQIAGCSDGQIQALGMNGNFLRQKARAFILAQREPQATKEDAKDKLIAEMQEQMKAMNEQMQKMAQAQPPVAEPSKRRGRPRKVKDANAAAVSQSGSS